MAQINIEEIKDKVEALEALRVQVNETEVSVIGYYDHDILLAVLEDEDEDEYPKLFSPVKNQILALLDGKKPLTKVDNATRVLLEFKLKGNCYLNNIEPQDKSGKLLPFNKISAKITKEINLKKRKIEENSILNLFKPKEEKAL